MHDQGLVAEVRCGDVPAEQGQAVPGRNGQHHGFPVEQMGIEGFAVEGRAGEAKVEFTGQQAVELLTGHQFLKVDIHVRHEARNLFQ